MNKNTTLFSLVIFLSTALLTTFPTATKALMMPDPHGVIIKEFKGKLYQMSYNEWHDVEILADLDDREVKPENWFKIIKSGNPNEANALINALSHFLSKDELWPYIETGLLRKNQENIPILDNVANRAFRMWSYSGNRDELIDIKTQPLYRKNLTPYVNWSQLFDYPNKDKLSLDDATDLLRDKTSVAGDYNQQRRRHYAINRIANHKNADDLKLLMKDENFEIALGSWVALAKIMPEQVASEVVNHALWIQDEVSYTYGSGCIRQTGKLVPIIAALDLFTDYLSVQQIRQALNELPEMWTQNKFDRLNVNHPKIKPVILEMKARNKDFNYFDRSFKHWERTEVLDQLNHLQGPIKDMNQAMSYVRVVGFDKKLNDFLLKTLNDTDDKSKSHKELRRFISYAFEKPNDMNHQFLEQVIQSSYFANNKEKMIHYFLSGKDVWPKKWQTMKQQVTSQLAGEITEDSYVPVTIELALN